VSNAAIRLEPAGDSLGYVEALLAENGLPAGDVHSKPGCFYIAFDGEDRVGVSGLERYGADGLLRSLVVEEPARGSGIGTAICNCLEREARAAGVERLWLLTTTAADFFAARGYERVDRSAAPERIRATTEFANLCPDTATCLRTSL